MNRIASALIVGSLVLFAGVARGQQCTEQLLECREELFACETERDTAQAELSLLTRDSDGDTAPDVRDQCPSTPPGVSIDAAGCSLDQFCSRQAIVRQRDRGTCRRLDWKNDEPHLVAKRDFVSAKRPGTGEIACTSTAGPDPSSACVTVELLLDYADRVEPVGVLLGLLYPESVSIPGFADQPSVLDRVENRTGISNGLFGVADNVDAGTARLNVGLIAPGQVVPRGSFALVHFDCVAGHPLPVAGDFACLSDAADDDGTVAVDCTVHVR